MLCYWYFATHLFNSKCDILHHRAGRRLACKNLTRPKRNRLHFCPFSLRNPRKEWTHVKNMLALWRNATYLFFFPPDITNCDKLLERHNGKSKPSSLPGNRLKHSTSATWWAKISTYSDPASALQTSTKKAVSWLEILRVRQQGSKARNINRQQQNMHGVCLHEHYTPSKLSCQTALVRGWSEDLIEEECRHEICDARSVVLGLKNKETECSALKTNTVKQGWTST